MAPAFMVRRCIELIPRPATPPLLCHHPMANLMTWRLVRREARLKVGSPGPPIPAERSGSSARAECQKSLRQDCPGLTRSRFATMAVCFLPNRRVLAKTVCGNWTLPRARRSGLWQRTSGALTALTLDPMAGFTRRVSGRMNCSQLISRQGNPKSSQMMWD